MAKASQQKSLVETYGSPQSAEYAREIERDQTNQVMQRRVQKFNTRQEMNDAFRDRMNNQGAVRAGDVEPAHQFMESTQRQSSVVQQYGQPQAAANGQGQEQVKQQAQAETQQRENSEEAKREHAAESMDRPSVVQKYGQTAEQSERQIEKEIQQQKDQSPDMAY